MAYKYAFKDYNAETMARCVVLAASVSTKHCIEICNHIKGRNLTQAKTILNDAIELKKAIPFKRFNHGIGHKRGMGPARFAVKACTEILKGLKSCEANASNKGLNTSDIIINHINAQMAARPWHYGRARRRKTKRTHIEIVLVEKSTSKQKKKTVGPKKTEKSETKKTPTTKTKPVTKTKTEDNAKEAKVKDTKTTEENTEKKKETATKDDKNVVENIQEEQVKKKETIKEQPKDIKQEKEDTENEPNKDDKTVNKTEEKINDKSVKKQEVKQDEPKNTLTED